jgi:OOP family OmpA-OmpF porin
MTNRTNSAPPPFGGQPDYAEDDSVMAGLGFWLIAIVLFVAMVAGAVIMGTSKIEADIETRAMDALQRNGYQEVIAEASGTAVTLYGTFTADQTQDAARLVVERVPGVSSVDGDLWFVTEGDAANSIIITGDAIEFSWDESSISVTGDISSEDRKTFIAAAFAPVFGSVDVGGFSVVEGLDDESDWIGTVLALAISVQDPIVTGRLIVVPDQELLVLTGNVESKLIRNALNKEVVEAGLAIGFDTNAAVRVPELPSETVAPTEEEVEALQIDLDILLQDKVVEFEVKSDIITETGRVLLDEIVEILRLAPEIKIEIAGHADAQGSASANMILSKARAASVLAYLVLQGENPDRYTSVGYGDTQPIADNNTDDGRARNRRIVFRALLEEGS